MSRPQDPHRPSIPFGNPFRMILPKGSYLSPKLLALLNNFEESLAEKVKKLKPRDKEDILSFSWLIHAMKTLCATHADILSLISALELPVCDWDEKWIDVYLDNSVKLLDICIAFTSELSRLSQGNLYLKCALQNLECNTDDLTKARSTLDGWRKHISCNNPRLEKCFSILDSLTQTLDLPKVKKSAKGKVLMRAMYGLKVLTVFVCSIFTVAFSGSAKKLPVLQVPEAFFWAQAFTDVQAFVNEEMMSIYSSRRVSVLKELEAVEESVKILFPITQNGAEETVKPEAFPGLISDMRKSADNLSHGVDQLSKEVDGFFRIVLTGREAFLGNLRIGCNTASQTNDTKNVKGQLVR